MRYVTIAGIGMIALLLAACQQPAPTASPARTSTPAPTPTQMLAVFGQQRVATPTPTPTRAPATKPRPTATPRSTATPRPAATPRPTAAPTATPSPAPASAAGPGPTPRPTATPWPPPEAALLIHQSQLAMSRVRTYHLRGTAAVLPSRDNPEVLVHAAFEGKGRIGGNYQAMFTLRVRIEGMVVEIPVEYRGLDGVSYLKDPTTGLWEVEDDWDMSGMFGSLGGLGQFREKQLDPRGFRVTLDVLEGSTVYRVFGRVQEGNRTTDLTLWIDRDSKLIRRIRAESWAPVSDYEGIVPADLQEVYEMQDTTLDRFNEPVEIEDVEITSLPTVEL